MPSPTLLAENEASRTPTDTEHRPVSSRRGASGLITNRLITNNVVFFLGAGVASALNYLFHPILGRILTVEQFGEVQALNSILVQLLISFAVLQIVVVNVVGNLPSNDDARAFIAALEKLIVAVGVAVAAVVVATSPFIRSALKLDSVIPVLLIAPAVGLGAIRSIRTGELQADQRFGSVSMVEITAGGARLIFAGSLAAAGFGTGGATLGLVASMPLTVLVATHLRRRRALPAATPPNLDTDREPPPTLAEPGALSLLRPHARFSIRAAWTALLIGMFVNGDNLVAKLVFDPETAGEYAGVSIISRIVFFVTASVAAVLLTSVKTQADARANLRSYAQSAAILTVPALAAVISFTVAPAFFVRLLVGESYTEYHALLPTLALAMLNFALVNLIVSFHLAVRDRGIGPIVTIAMMAAVAVIIANHETPSELARSVLVGSGTALGLCLVWTIHWNVRSLRRD